jgi:hypothetical protein
MLSNYSSLWGQFRIPVLSCVVTLVRTRSLKENSDVKHIFCSHYNRAAACLYSGNASRYGYMYIYNVRKCTWWRTWLRHCATSWKVVGSIPDSVIGIFHWRNLSGRTVALGSTQPLTEMRTRNISWGSKGSRCIGLTALPPSCAKCLIWEPQPPGTLRASPGL